MIRKWKTNFFQKAKSSSPDVFYPTSYCLFKISSARNMDSLAPASLINIWTFTHRVNLLLNKTQQQGSEWEVLLEQNCLSRTGLPWRWKDCWECPPHQSGHKSHRSLVWQQCRRYRKSRPHFQQHLLQLLSHLAWGRYTSLFPSLLIWRLPQNQPPHQSSQWVQFQDLQGNFSYRKCSQDSFPRQTACEVPGEHGTKTLVPGSHRCGFGSRCTTRDICQTGQHSGMLELATSSPPPLQSERLDGKREEKR